MSVRPDGVRRARVIEVIEAVSLVGSGDQEDDPVREVTFYYSPNGVLLAKSDPIKEMTVHDEVAR